MADQLSCRQCAHFIEMPMRNGEAPLYFCGSEDTKEGPQPIGFIRFDAPSCRFFSSYANGAKKTPIIIIAPPTVPQPEKTPRFDEGTIVRWILSLSAIISLVLWAAAHIAAQIPPLTFRLH